MSTARTHALVNQLQTLLLVLTLLGLSALSGGLLFGETGLWVALIAAGVALIFEPTAASWLTLRLYRAQPISPEAAPGLWQTLAWLSERAGLPALPIPHYVASPMVNAFAVGNRARSAIALTDGLLRTLTARELTGVLAHEVAHIAHGDLRVMGLADYVSRLTSLFALPGQFLLLLALPMALVAEVEINWWGLLLLAVSPHIALIAQLGLSRVREYDADRRAAEFTGDPEGLASALARIERVSRSWRAWLMPGWGNPEPSWLRTHPVTEERVRRLLEMATRQDRSPGPRLETLWEQARYPRPLPGNPRLRLGGFWW
ncbi:MAG: zinc metalloprotease HtpX [Thiobacillaceae bacterium]